MFLILCVILNLCFCYANQDIWHSYQFDATFAREELVITNITTDNTFKLSKHVTNWKSVSSNGKVYAVGLLGSSVVTLIAELSSDDTNFVTTEKVSEFSWTITDFEVFEHWNFTAKKSEIILILSTSSTDAPELHWYKINENDFEHFWTWHVHKNITHLRFLQFDDDKDRLLILQDTAFDNFGLYEFVLGSTSNEFWLSQTMSLSSPANTSALNFYGSDFYLSIPQKEQNEVKVYKLEDNHFKFYHRIRSGNVEHVSAFKIGFKSFLAVSGEDGGIYKFGKDNIELEDLKELPLNNVDFWLPVPIKTYRDEVVLIMQRHIFHGGHESFSLDVIIYDGQRFYKHDEVPCHYFGEVMHGLDCMVDEEGHLGLYGSAVLSLKGVLGIIVPHKSSSVLYRIHSMLKSVKSPIELEIEKLKETRAQLEKMIEQQKLQIESLKRPIKTIEKASLTETTNNKPMEAKFEAVATLIPVSDDLQVDIQEVADRVNKIKILLNETRNIFSTVLLPTVNSSLTLSGQLEVLGKTEVNNLNVKFINNDEVHDMFQDVVRKHHLGEITGLKTFASLNVHNINFETVNGISARDIVFKTQNSIEINGNLIFENVVKVNDNVTAIGSINELDLINEIVEMRKSYEEPLHFEHVKINQNLNTLSANNISVSKSSDDIVGFEEPNLHTFDTDVIELLGNITIKNVNGENFNAFRKSLYFTNVETYLSGDTYIDGEINVLDSADVQYLNDVKFPNDYVLTSWKYVTITGEKHFEEPIIIDQLILSGEINGVNPNTILTLTTNQSVTGKYIFDDFEATDTLNVEGEILGPYVDQLVPNPSLTESNVINAKVIMNELEVDGVVTVTNNYNNQNFEDTLQDIVYKNEPFANITAAKNFTNGFSVTNGINSLSGAINNVPITSLVTTDTDQELLLKTLNGPVVFENLVIGGVYGGINVTKLEEDTVKLSGDQFVAAELTFINNYDNFVDLSATKMEILGTINGLPFNNYYYTSEDGFELTGEDLITIKAQNVVVQGNVFGPISGFSLENFNAYRLSSTKHQEVTAQYTVKNLHSKVFNAKIINEKAFEELFDYHYYVSKIENDLLSGRVNINRLDVNGSVFINNMNEQNVTDLIKNYLWSNQNNYFNTAVFDDHLFVNQMNVKYFNGLEFGVLFDNIVYNNEQNVIFSGFKTFTNGLHISKMLNSEYLNGIYVDHILTKTGEQEMDGPLNIIGNVVIKDSTQIHDTLNGVSVPYLAKTYMFVDNTVVINDDLVFHRLPYVNNLIVQGYVNNQNLMDFFKDVVYKHQPANIPENTTFANKIIINDNLIVSNNVNDIDFSDFVQEMVLITSDDLIGGKVTFTETVVVDTELIVDLDLNTNYLNDILLDRWKNTAVFVNRGLIPKKLMFDYVTVQGNLYANYINDVEINSLIPLRTDQYINRSLEFTEITSFRNVSVKTSVNGYNLLDEFYNTVLMSKSSHEITSDVVFENNVVVDNNLYFQGLVNNKNLSKAVTTNTEQILTANYEFASEITLQSDFKVNGLINNINITNWLQKSVKTFSKDLQIINDVWVANDKVVFGENVTGNGLIGGLNIQNVASLMEEKRLMEMNSQDGLLNYYINMCKNVSAVMSVAESQIFLFRYLEYLEKFTFENSIENVHHFQVNAHYYMLVTEINACASHLLTWVGNAFEQIAIVKTGSVLQMVTVYDRDLVFLVSRSNFNVKGCEHSGTLIWKFEQNDLTLLYTLEDYKLLQESLVPSTFYAMSKNCIVEFHLITNKETNVKIYRKWITNTDNFAFVPRGLGTGLAISNGFEMLKLLRTDAADDVSFGYETEAFIRGEVVTEKNSFLPSYRDGYMVVMNVGFGNEKRSLVAVALHEETSVKRKLDVIAIYEDILNGKLFHKIPTYKPSSLISLEFGKNGETLLMFLEDEKILNVYEYKGIEGFKRRTSVKLSGSKLVSIKLPAEKNNVHQYIVGVVNKNKLKVIYAVTTGNQMNIDKPKCRI